MLTQPIAVPIRLQYIYGETTTYRDLITIHGSALIASVLALNWVNDTSGSLTQQIAIVVLSWDLAGGLVAHSLPQNRHYWQSLGGEWLVVWAISYAWQPLLFGSQFGGGVLLLAGFHIASILLILGQYVFGSRPLLIWLGLALLSGLYLNTYLSITDPLRWVAPLYLIKAVIFAKTSRRSPSVATS